MEDTQIIPVEASELQKNLLHILNALEVEVRNGKTLLPLGIDTELVARIRNHLTGQEKEKKSKPQLLELNPEAFAIIFARIFLALLARVNITDNIAVYDFEAHGSRLSIIISLKSDKYTYENRAKIYSLKSEVVNGIKELEDI